MIDGRNELIRFSESERTMTHPLNLIVHSFESPIEDPELGPGQEAGETISDQACKFDERLQPGVGCPPEPLFEVGLGSFFLKVIPKPLEFLFQIISPDDRKVEFKQTREPPVFLGSEIPRVLEQDEPSLFEIDHLLMSQPSDFGPSNFIKVSIQVLDDIITYNDSRFTYAAKRSGATSGASAC